MKYMVCWLSCLLGEKCKLKNISDNAVDQNFYMIEARNKKDAVAKLLRRMAATRLATVGDDYANECIINMVRGIYRHGKLDCLNNGLIQRDFAYETNLVATGNYYNPEVKQGLTTEDADILGILKEIDTSVLSEIIDERLFIEVFVEAYRYDVAVIALNELETKQYC